MAGMGVITAQGRELTEMIGSYVNGCNGQVSQVAGGEGGTAYAKALGQTMLGMFKGQPGGNTTGAEWGGRN